MNFAWSDVDSGSSEEAVFINSNPYNLNLQNVLDGKPEGKRIKQINKRSMIKWLNKVEQNLQRIKVKN